MPKRKKKKKRKKTAKGAGPAPGPCATDFLDAYIAGASDIIGERTPEEAAYDRTVVDELNRGRSIQEALRIAGEKHPQQALQWDDDTLGDIAAFYDYLKTHEEIMRKLGMASGR